MANRTQKQKDNSIAELQIGESRVVTTVDGDDLFTLRLASLGFTPQTTVTCVAISPIGGIKAYRVKETIIALRKNDAKRIECKI